MSDKPELRPTRPESALVPALLPYERHSVAVSSFSAQQLPKASQSLAGIMYGGLSLTAEKAAAEPTKREIRASFIFAGGC